MTAGYLTRLFSKIGSIFKQIFKVFYWGLRLAVSILLVGILVRGVYELAIIIWDLMVFSFYLPEFIKSFL